MDWVIQAILVFAIFCIGGMVQAYYAIRIVAAASDYLKKSGDYNNKRDANMNVCGTRDDNYGVSLYAFYTQNLDKEFRKVLTRYRNKFGWFDEYNESRPALLEIAIYKHDIAISDRQLRYNKTANKIIRFWLAKHKIARKLYQSNMIPAIPSYDLKKGLI